MLTITASQCRRARGLLKWNLRDLHHKTNISATRLDNFERSLLHLQQNENKALYNAFEEEGIVFRGLGEVVLDLARASKKEASHESQSRNVRHQGEHIQISDDEDFRRLAGFSELTSRTDSSSQPARPAPSWRSAPFRE